MTTKAGNTKSKAAADAAKKARAEAEAKAAAEAAAKAEEDARAKAAADAAEKAMAEAEAKAAAEAAAKAEEDAKAKAAADAAEKARAEAEAKAKAASEAQHARARAFLADFASDLPHEAECGLYSFNTRDRWYRTRPGLLDGWYRLGEWSVQIHGGMPITAVRADNALSPRSVKLDLAARS